MERFRPDGHLTDAALLELSQNQDPGQLGRLEIAEHLAYCDLCLQRYTDALACVPLLTPEKSCQKSIWRRIHRRTIRLLTSRYATAAAAVGLALTLLWSDIGTGFTGQLRACWDRKNASPETRWSLQILPDFSENLDQSIQQLVTGFHGLFDSVQSTD